MSVSEPESVAKPEPTKKKSVASKVAEKHSRLQRPKQVAEMELRAQQRAQKRVQLQQLYEEKRKLQEDAKAEEMKL